MIFTIAGKELKALFASPLAWLVLSVVQVIVGYAFLRRLDEFLQLQPQFLQMANPPGATESVAAYVFTTAAGVFLFAIPILAMRLVAEERRNQTLVLLMSAPVSMTEIVLGKFTGLLAFLVAIITLLALMPLSLAFATQLDYSLIAGFVAGLILLAASFTAVSLFVSCLTVHPVVAAFGAFAGLLGMLLAGDVAGDGLKARGWSVAASLAQVLSPFRNFEPFGRGMMDTYAIACSLVLTFVFLALAVRHLEARRLRG